MTERWRPVATPAAWRARADVHAAVRSFFAARGVLEVETPLLAQAPVTDPGIEPFAVAGYYLQTSPEYAMKRLLAAGSGPIFQICKAFRAAESGRRHNPEFSMLEWYRPGFGSAELMQEVEDLLRPLLPDRHWARISYRQLFLDYLDIEPHSATAAELQALALARIDTDFTDASRDQWLDLLLSHLIEPQLAATGMLFVYDYPASQCALAALAERDGTVVSDRFELYAGSLELANGYRELLDPAEQLRRFKADQLQPAARDRPLDERLLAALAAGLPSCAGVALGLDRLLMTLLDSEDLDSVLTFPWDRA